jgi:succinyl-CoA synthetase beta subunit
VTPQEARCIAEELGEPVVVKAQVLVGGRGKAGGVRPAQTPAEAEQAAAAVLALEIKGLPVRRVLVEEAADVDWEIYLGLAIDRAARRPVLMASAAGGMDIEEVARTRPDAIHRIPIDPFLGLRPYQTLALAKGVGLATEQRIPFERIARALYETFCACDATLAEINPLAVTGAGDLLALDAKIVLDDNALFRHPDLAAWRDADEETPVERQARETGLSYVQLDGEIGCVVNGAGLAMATMDVIRHFGGAPANFLDIGGGAHAERVTAALRLVLSDTRVRAVLLNIFGGITRCDEVARGLVAALEELEPAVPFVVRLVGTNEAEGREILARSG